jgi:hypothetical protein
MAGRLTTKLRNKLAAGISALLFSTGGLACALDTCCQLAQSGKQSRL